MELRSIYVHVLAASNKDNLLAFLSQLDGEDVETNEGPRQSVGFARLLLGPQRSPPRCSARYYFFSSKLTTCKSLEKNSRKRKQQVAMANFPPAYPLKPRGPELAEELGSPPSIASPHLSIICRILILSVAAEISDQVSSRLGRVTSCRARGLAHASLTLVDQAQS